MQSNDSGHKNAKLNRLCIITHVVHTENDGKYYAYGPYAKEIHLWRTMFEEVVIAGPVVSGKPKGDDLDLGGSGVKFVNQIQSGGVTIWSKIRQVLLLPAHVWNLLKCVVDCDAVQVRVPGNIGGIGLVLACLVRKPRVAKYAGQWKPFRSEPLSWKLQKWILRSRLWSAPTFVYGKCVGDPEHILPFFTSVMSDTQMCRAQAVARRRTPHAGRNVLFVGRLTPERNVQVLLRAVKKCVDEGVDLRLKIVGDGVCRSSLESEARDLALGGVVSFVGAIPHDDVMVEYERNDILVLVAESEGWGKAIIEGMAFGLMCVGANRGSVPWLLGEGRGKLVEPGDVEGMALAIREIVAAPEVSWSTGQRASEWVQQFSIERLEAQIRKSLESAWGVTLCRGTTAKQSPVSSEKATRGTP